MQREHSKEARELESACATIIMLMLFARLKKATPSTLSSSGGSGRALVTNVPEKGGSSDVDMQGVANNSHLATARLYRRMKGLRACNPICDVTQVNSSEEVTIQVREGLAKIHERVVQVCEGAMKIHERVVQVQAHEGVAEIPRVEVAKEKPMKEWFKKSRLQ